MERKGIKEADQIVRTMAEKLRQEGGQEGREEGKKEGRREELINITIELIKKKLKIDIIPEEVKNKIEKAELEELKKLTENIFEINSFDEVNNYLS